MASRRRTDDRAELAAATAEVRAVYAEVAARPVERACIRRTECCQFRLTGRTPMLTRGEALVAAKAVRASGRTKLPERADGACPLLAADGRCLIYEGHVDRALGGDGPRAIGVAVKQAMEASI
jgi:uncharacterized protein